MNLVTLSGYIRRKNPIKKTRKGDDCLTFELEVTTDGKKDKFLCVVFNRLVVRVDRAVDVDDKVLVHGTLSRDKAKGGSYIVNVSQLELLDFIRYEDKTRDDKYKQFSKKVQEALKRIGR